MGSVLVVVEDVLCPKLGRLPAELVERNAGYVIGVSRSHLCNNPLDAIASACSGWYCDHRHARKDTLPYVQMP